MHPLLPASPTSYPGHAQVFVSPGGRRGQRDGSQGCISPPPSHSQCPGAPPRVSSCMLVVSGLEGKVRVSPKSSGGSLTSMLLVPDSKWPFPTLLHPCSAETAWVAFSVNVNGDIVVGFLVVKAKSLSGFKCDIRDLIELLWSQKQIQIKLERARFNSVYSKALWLPCSQTDFGISCVNFSKNVWFIFFLNK